MLLSIDDQIGKMVWEWNVPVSYCFQLHFTWNRPYNNLCTGMLPSILQTFIDRDADFSIKTSICSTQQKLSTLSLDGLSCGKCFRNQIFNRTGQYSRCSCSQYCVYIYLYNKTIIKTVYSKLGNSYAFVCVCACVFHKCVHQHHCWTRNVLSLVTFCVDSFTATAQDTSLYNEFGIHTFDILTHLPWAKYGLYRPFCWRKIAKLNHSPIRSVSHWICPETRVLSYYMYS